VSIRIAEQPVPLVAGDDGVIRVRGTRVTLDSIVDAFRLGGTAEEISQQYPTMALAEVYSILAFYLHHQSEIDDYIRKGQSDAERLRARVEKRFPPDGIRARLLARRPHGRADTGATSV
jgi:uncharacterized protein (DUF433 family)